MSPHAPSTRSVPVLPVEERLDPAHQPVADEDREHVVAVLPLRLGNVHLEPVAKVEQRLSTVAIVDQAVERGEERHPLGDWTV